MHGVSYCAVWCCAVLCCAVLYRDSFFKVEHRFLPVSSDVGAIRLACTTIVNMACVCDGVLCEYVCECVRGHKIGYSTCMLYYSTNQSISYSICQPSFCPLPSLSYPLTIPRSCCTFSGRCMPEVRPRRTRFLRGPVFFFTQNSLTPGPNNPTVFD